MARVPKQSAASVGTGADRHKKAEQKKASYKVTYEEISQKKKLKHYVRLSTWSLICLIAIRLSI